MQMRWRFSFSFVFLLLGFGILWVSLFSASEVIGNGNSPATDMRFYVGEEILPDHVAYPLLMIADRARLEASSPKEAVYMKVEYSERRLNYAKKMIEADKKSLAMSTLTKSQKYLNQAAQDSLDQKLPDQDRKFVMNMLDYNLAEIDKLADSFGNEDRSILSHLCSEGKIFRERLKQSLAK